MNKPLADQQESSLMYDGILHLTFLGDSDAPVLLIGTHPKRAFPWFYIMVSASYLL